MVNAILRRLAGLILLAVLSFHYGCKSAGSSSGSNSEIAASTKATTGSSNGDTTTKEQGIPTDSKVIVTDEKWQESIFSYRRAMRNTSGPCGYLYENNACSTGGVIGKCVTLDSSGNCTCAQASGSVDYAGSCNYSSSSQECRSQTQGQLCGINGITGGCVGINPFVIINQQLRLR